MQLEASGGILAKTDGDLMRMRDFLQEIHGQDAARKMQDELQEKLPAIHV